MPDLLVVLLDNLPFVEKNAGVAEEADNQHCQWSLSSAGGDLGLRLQ